MAEREEDFYADNLAEVNQSNAVLTTEDICNQQGAIIVPKGAPITPAIARCIVKHKLMKPLESSVALETSIDAKGLYTAIASAAASAAVPEDDGQGLSFEKQIRQACGLFVKFPLLVQKLTVFSIRLPVHFDKTLLTAYTALGLARRMKLEATACMTVFVAALMRDVGLLHIDPEIVQSKAALTPEEWRTLQGHVAIGKLFLEEVEGLPKQVARAVLEHHERTDGTGYPFGKFGDKLCVEGQIVGMAETMTAIYYKQVVGRGYTLASLVPILQISATLHFYPTFQAAVEILKSAQASRVRVYDDADMPGLITEVIQRINAFSQWYDLSRPLTAELTARLPQEKMRIANTIAARLNQTIATSGLLSQVHRRWLEHVLLGKEKESYEEVEYMALMSTELSWQCCQWHKALATPLSGLGDKGRELQQKYEEMSALANGQLGEPEVVSSERETA